MKFGESESHSTLRTLVSRHNIFSSALNSA